MPRPLPAELVLAIPLLVADSDAYRETLQAFCACSLVSRSFCAIAQPLLWRVVAVGSAEQATAIEEAMRTGRGMALATHTRVVELAGMCGIDLDQGLRLLRRFRRLEKVHVHRFEDELDLAELERFPALTSLNIQYINVSDLPFTLSPLLELSITFVGMPPVASTAFFAPNTFPSLKALSISDLADHDEKLSYCPTLSEAFLGQLDILQVSGIKPSSVPLSAYADRVPLLYTLSPNEVAMNLIALQADCPSHLRVTLSDEYEEIAGAVEVLLTDLEYFLFEAPRPLRSVHLPDFLREADRSQHMVMVLDKILRACNAQNIDVLWHMVEPDEDEEREISPEFWAYVKGLQAAKLSEGEAEELGEGTAEEL
ncbi:hypothetical protein JCM10213_005769 [Rhodosporidiobolus nylandii]